MAKRKKTRKKTAATAPKKAKNSRQARKKAKKKRISSTKRVKVAKKQARPKKGPIRKKTAKKKAAAKKLAKKRTVKKKAIKKKDTAKTTASKASARNKTVKKKAAKVARKDASKKAVKVEITAPEEPGLPLKEIRARLGLIGPQIAALSWLEGLYLYGSVLLQEARHERVDFIVVYRGLRSAGRLKGAETELRELIGAVLPIEFELSTGSPEIGRLLGEGNPAAQAHLGYSEPIFARGI